MRATGFCSRFLAGVLTLWFGLVMAAPAILHACPTSLAADSATGAQGEHAPHGAHRHPTGQNSNAPTDCRCLGTCAASSPAVLPPVPAVPLAVLAPTDEGAASLNTGAVGFLRADHLQPLATAPPFRSA